MEKVVIERCVTRPGIIKGARTYHLALKDSGLYIIELGKAMTPNMNKSTAASDAILNKIEQKRDIKINEKLTQIKQNGLDYFVDQKKNFLIKPNNVSDIKLSNMDFIPQLSIKSDLVKITLYFDQEANDKLEKINAYFTKT